MLLLLNAVALCILYGCCWCSWLCCSYWRACIVVLGADMRRVCKQIKQAQEATTTTNNIQNNTYDRLVCMHLLLVKFALYVGLHSNGMWISSTESDGSVRIYMFIGHAFQWWTFSRAHYNMNSLLEWVTGTEVEKEIELASERASERAREKHLKLKFCQKKKI